MKAMAQPRPYRTYVALLVAVIAGNFIVLVVYRFDLKHSLLTLAMRTNMRVQAPAILSVNRTRNITKTSNRTSDLQRNKTRLRTGNATFKILSTAVTKLLEHQTTKMSIFDNLNWTSPTAKEIASIKLWYGNDSFKVPTVASFPGMLSAPGSFKVAITPDEKWRMMNLFRTFHHLMRNNGIRYMVYGGTLIGAYRHHGLIPWDDDIDVWVDYEQRDDLLKAMRRAGSAYSAWTTRGPFQWKFYYTASKPIKHKEWRWPFIDIFFYTQNSTHVWDHNTGCCRSYIFKRKDIFPLRQLPYEGWTYPGPCNVENVLKVVVRDLKYCQSGWFDHKHESARISNPVQTMACSKLFPYFPFVFRTNLGNMVNETLLVGYKHAHHILTPKYCNSGST